MCVASRSFCSSACQVLGGNSGQGVENPGSNSAPPPPAKGGEGNRFHFLLGEPGLLPAPALWRENAEEVGGGLGPQVGTRIWRGVAHLLSLRLLY